MSTGVKSWVQAFGLSENDYNSWKSETPSGVSVTYWCLKTHKIDEVEYLRWAQEQYGLAVLNSSYFQNPPPQELWGQIQTVTNWSPFMLPLAQWDGVIFVGCVEPLEMPWSFPVRYVLARPEDLESYWNQLNPAAAVTPKPLPIPDIPVPPPQRARIPDSMPMNLEDHPYPKETTQPPPIEKPMDMPEGLNLGGVYPTPPTAQTPDDIQTQSQIIIGPEGLQVAEKAKDEPTPVAPVRMPAPVIKQPYDHLDTELIPSAKNSFEELKKTFSRSLLLRFEGKEFQVGLQDGSWTPKDDTAHEYFKLDEPSVFRIVSRTGLPYHGYVTSSSMNDAFFQRWGMPALPEQLTICPITIQSQVVAAFLCVGTKDQNTEKHLQVVQKVTAQFAEHLNRHYKKSAA